MPFQQDAAVAEAAGELYGNYLATFLSGQGQIVAHLFQQGDWLVAHVSTPTGLEYDEITDPYLEELRRFARDRGYEGKLRIVYAE
jgi:hypothetical protein